MGDDVLRVLSCTAIALIATFASSRAALASEVAATPACASIDDDTGRLACYDSIYPRVGSPAQRTVAATAGAPAASAPAASGVGVGGAVSSGGGKISSPADPADEFGLSPAAIIARKDPATTPPPVTSITGSIAKVSNRPTGEWVVTLDDGQVWAQIDASSRARLVVGESVTIRKASLGSYLLVTSGGIATRVRRVR